MYMVQETHSTSVGRRGGQGAGNVWGRIAPHGRKGYSRLTHQRKIWTQLWAEWMNCDFPSALVSDLTCNQEREVTFWCLAGEVTWGPPDPRHAFLLVGHLHGIYLPRAANENPSCLLIPRQSDPVMEFSPNG